jgi:hypothetical protein
MLLELRPGKLQHVLAHSVVRNACGTSKHVSPESEDALSLDEVVKAHGALSSRSEPGRRL